MPQPKVLSWINGDNFDYFAGTHNSYDSINVDYIREVLFFKDDFWIVFDRFSGEKNHCYQQIWQGLYHKNENNKFAQTNFSDTIGLEIAQLNNGIEYTRKQWSPQERGRKCGMTCRLGKGNTIDAGYHDLRPRILDAQRCHGARGPERNHYQNALCSSAQPMGFHSITRSQKASTQTSELACLRHRSRR